MCEAIGEKRGRPKEYDIETISDFLLAQKDRLLTETGKIRGKTDTVWIRVHEELKTKVDKVPASLYTFVTCNRGNVKDKLLQALGKEPTLQQFNNSDESRLQEQSTRQDSSFQRPVCHDFVLELTAAAFDSLLVIKEHQITKKNKKIKREVIRMQEG